MAPSGLRAAISRLPWFRKHDVSKKFTSDVAELVPLAGRSEGSEPAAWTSPLPTGASDECKAVVRWEWGSIVFFVAVSGCLRACVESWKH